MVIKTRKSDVIWGYIGTILNSGINIFILPFILALLPSAELGLWYTFTSVGALVTLFDFGFSMNLTRNFSYSWCGARKLMANGIELIAENHDPNYHLFWGIYSISKLIYMYISLAILLILGTVGTIYISSICVGIIDKVDYLAPWITYIFAVSINMFYSYWTPVLKGIGAVKEEYQNNVISKAVQLIVSVGMLLAGYGLLGISVGYLAAGITKRAMAIFKFRGYIKDTYEKVYENKDSISKEERIVIFKAMWPNTFKQGLMTMSQYMTDKFSVLICSSFIGLEASSMYGLTVQILGVITTVGTVLYNTRLPYINRLRTENDTVSLYDVFSKSVGVQTFTIIIGGMSALLVSPFLLRLIGSQSSIMSFSSGILLLFFNYIHYNQSIHVSFIISSNKLPMVNAYIISAICVVLGEFVMVKLLPGIGIVAIIIPMIIVEATYNGWKWPLYVCREFGVSVSEFYKDSLICSRDLFVSIFHKIGA